MASLNDSSRFIIRQAYLLLTRKCNLSCSHCIRSSDSSFSEFISFDLATSVISQIADDNSAASMLISGGEPTLHPRFFDIVEYATSRLKTIMINTNGLSLNRLLILRTLKNVPKIQISVDGFRDSHEIIRGKCTYDVTLRNIALLAADFDLTVSTTVSNKNIDTIHRLDYDLASIPFNNWALKRVVAYGRADRDDDVSTDIWNGFAKKAITSFENKHRVRIARMFSLDSIVNRQECNKNNYHNAFSNCGTGRSKIYINPNGTVYPCACMEHLVFADFRVDGLSDIKDKLSVFDFAPDKSSICYQCRAWSECQGGCPGRIISFSRLGDPRCPIVKKAYGIPT